MTEIEYKGNIWTFDILNKNVYKNGQKIWHDDENQIGDPEYYKDFKEWVEDHEGEWAQENEADWFHPEIV